MVLDSKAKTKVDTIAIITPVWNESQNLARYEEAVRDILLSRDDVNYRIIMIDDGSTDDSWEKISAICARDDRFEGIRFSRNFGSHIALAAGFDHVECDAYAVVACDLQDPPAVVNQFVDEWRKGNNIVWGERRNREDSVWRVFTSIFFSTMVRKFAMPKGSKFTTGSFFLMDDKVANYCRKFRESNRITFAIVAWTGFKQTKVSYDRIARLSGKSGWTFGRMIKAMYDVFIGFSPLPIQLITVIGGLVSILAICLSIYLFTNWLLGAPAEGWTSIMLLMTIFFGVQFLLLGVLSQYLYRIFLEVVRRPLYFVTEKTNGLSPTDEADDI